MANESSRAAQGWKEKYLKALDELEHKERHWRETEAVLRLAVSRVILAADIRDERLAHHLNALRQAVRGTIEPKAVQSRLDAMGEILRQMGEAGVAPAEDVLVPLRALLERLEVPRALRGKAKAWPQDSRPTRRVTGKGR